MSCPLKFTPPGSRVDTEVSLIADRSLFHDMFRSYGGTEPAEWFWAYVTVRRGLDPTPVVLAANATMSRLEQEFAAISHTGNSDHNLPTLLKATRSYIRTVDLPANISAKDAAIYLSMVQYDLGSVPVLISSIGHDKLLEKAHSAGMDMHLDGFTPAMSRRRLEKGRWFLPIDASGVDEILALTDSFYSQVVDRIGPTPPTQKGPKGRPSH